AARTNICTTVGWTVGNLDIPDSLLLLLGIATAAPPHSRSSAGAETRLAGTSAQDHHACNADFTPRSSHGPLQPAPEAITSVYRVINSPCAHTVSNLVDVDRHIVSKRIGKAVAIWYIAERNDD